MLFKFFEYCIFCQQYFLNRRLYLQLSFIQQAIQHIWVLHTEFYIITPNGIHHQMRMYQTSIRYLYHLKTNNIAANNSIKLCCGICRKVEMSTPFVLKNRFFFHVSQYTVTRFPYLLCFISLYISITTT